jgi:hypothetical protein
MTKKVLLDVAKTKKVAEHDAEEFREKGWKVTIEPATRQQQHLGKFSGRYAIYYTGKRKQ